MKPAWWFVRVNTDTSLSHAARQLVSWFGSQPRGWRYSVAEAQAAMGVGRQKYQQTLAELKDAGLIVTTYKHDKRTGQIMHTNLVVRDTAAPGIKSGVPEGGKSCLRSASPEGGFQGRRPEGGKSGQTSLSDREGNAPAKGAQIVGLRMIAGGRNV